MSLVLVAVVIAVLPWVVGKYFVALALLVGIYVIATTGLTLLMGFAGQVSLAQAAFYGIGAYASTILTTRLGVPVWLGMVIAPVVAGLVAWIIGGPSLRLHGHYLALATLAFGIIVFIVFLEAPALTGGPSGTIGIPRLRLGPWTLTQDREYYHVVWAVALSRDVLSLREQHVQPVGTRRRRRVQPQLAAQRRAARVGAQRVVHHDAAHP